MRLLFLVNNYFPAGTAYSSRAVSFCKLLHYAGFHVHVIAAYSRMENYGNPKIHDLGYCTFQISSGRDANPLYTYFGNPDFKKCAEEFIHNDEPDIVFTSSNGPHYLWIANICKHNNIPCFVEQCEWMDASNFSFGKLDPRYIRMMRLMNGGYRRSDGIISISRLLDNHYNDIGIRSIRIPTILDIKNTPFAKSTNNQKTVVVYTGNPGMSKEYLSPMIQVLADDGELRKEVEFHIYGPSKALVLRNIEQHVDWLSAAGESFIIHGPVPQENIQNILMNADYQFFARPDRRSSHAGFPTKMAESMAVGTPVITNNTGDIGLYLRDGHNGIMLERADAEAVDDALWRIVAMDTSTKEEMRRNARETAERFFDYRCYKSQLSEFLRRIIDAH